MDDRILYLAIVGAIGLERLGELALSRRNAARTLRRGGMEFGRRHYPWMVGVHVAFLVACPLEVFALGRPWVPALAAAMAVVLVAALALRYWAIATLGERWSTRVVVVPGEPAITAGPYRFVRHPNYLAVILELVALPMLHTAWLTALLASAANAVLLRTRIVVEEAALRQASDYAARLAGRPRFVPGLG